MLSIVVSIISLYSSILSGVRRWLFLVQTFIWQGKAILEADVRFLHPVSFQGRGSVYLQRNVRLGYKLAGASRSPILLQPRTSDALIRVGAGSIIVNGTEIIALRSVTIGENCRIGARTTIFDSDFHGIRPDERDTPGIIGSVVINDNVWVGADAMILKNVTIGHDAVIGARCVVTKDVPAGAIVAGNPMKIVGSVYDR